MLLIGACIHCSLLIAVLFFSHSLTPSCVFNHSFYQCPSVGFQVDAAGLQGHSSYCARSAVNPIASSSASSELQPFPFFFLHLYWSIIALQCCVSCCCIANWISFMYTYIPISPPFCVSLPHTLSHSSRWTQRTELISLCYAAASH